MEYYSYVYRVTINLEDGSQYHYCGSRYCKMTERYSYDALGDFKKYQTSSSNEDFKTFLLENINDSKK